MLSETKLEIQAIPEMAKSQKTSAENRSSYLEITDRFVSNIFKTF